MNPSQPLGNLSGGAGLAPTARESQINREFALLSKEVNENSELSRNLCERLSPILRNDPEPVQSSDKQLEEPLVAMADMLRKARKEVACSNALLRGILQRAEI